MDEKIVETVLQAKGNLERYLQEIEVGYLRKNPATPGKVYLSIKTTNPEEQRPRSFRTANPDTAVKIARAILRAVQKMKEEGIEEERK